jgi:hypothetical protein
MTAEGLDVSWKPIEERAPGLGFGFSWPWPFPGEIPLEKGLEKLGFAWILSSEMSLFNGLRANSGGGVFAFPSPREALAEAAGRRRRQGRN